MSLLVYGIVEAGGVAVSGEGLEGQPLSGVAEGPLLAVVSQYQGAHLEPTAASVTVYEQAVRRLMERDAILPAQFGSVLDDDAAVRAMLRGRREDLLTRLRRVRGAVEIDLRASWRNDAPAEARPESGTSYLRERLELRQRARRVANELDPLTQVAVSARRTLAPRPDLPVLDAYLVDRERVREFVALVEQLDRRLDDIELVCTGPWPPYSFTGEAPV